MKIARAELPWPFLAETRIVAQGSAGAWHDLRSVLGELGFAQAPESNELPAMLAYLGRLDQGRRKKLEHALDAHRDGAPAPHFLKPIEPLAKILLTEGRVALSRSNEQLPAKMVVGFSKFASALADPGITIRFPDPEAQYDAEAVLVAVMGKEATRVGAGAAARSVIGFTLMAEITHRDMFEREWKTSNSLFAKNCRSLSPLGPAIHVAGLRELDPATEVTLSVNGTVRQRFAVADFAHGIANATKAWSRCVLEPGDMVALGAAIAQPSSANEVDSPIPVAAGDRIEVACAPIGALTASFAA